MKTNDPSRVGNMYAQIESLETRRFLSLSMVDFNLATRGSSPGEFTEVNGTTFFTAEDATGTGLWETDGTDQGTHLIQHAGAGLGSPTLLTSFHGQLYFINWKSSNDLELWKSNGTAAGTKRILDLPSDGNSAYVPEMRVIGDSLYFGVTNAGIFRSDGTAAGTTLLKQTTGEISSIKKIGNSIYFTELAGTPVMKIWRSDGTPGGTNLITSTASCPPVAHGNDAYFINSNNQLIKVNSADGSLVTVKQLTGQLDNHSTVLGSTGGKLMLMTGDAWYKNLWQSDGTGNGTVIIKTFDSEYLSKSLVVDDAVYFVLSDGFKPTLWTTDGTAGGTIKLKELAVHGSDIPNDFVAVGSTLYFSAKNASTDARELWKTNGTVAGTALVVEASPDTPYQSDIRLNLAAIGNQLFFRGQTPGTGWELWTSNGTGTGSHLVRDINTSTADSNPNVLGFINGRAIVLADDGYGLRRFWSTDGTPQGTILLSNVPAGQSLGDDHTAGIVFNGELYFGGLWKTDGTLQGTKPVFDAQTQATIGGANQYVIFHGKLCFVGQSGIYATDGTQEGTSRIKAGFGAQNLKAVGDKLYFTMPWTGWTSHSTAGWHGPQLWVSDGTEGSTQLVKDFYPTAPSGYPRVGTPTDLIDFNGTLLFRYSYDVSNPSRNFGGIYRSDGTAAGTTLITAAGQTAYALQKIRNAVYFVSQSELWRTDGTLAGTVRLTHQGKISPQVVFAGKYFFFATETRTTVQLWRTDGTDAGTQMVKEIAGGGRSVEMSSVNGKLFFIVTDDDHGDELWQSDGTSDGTSIVRDIWPGVDGSFPKILASGGNKIAFAASNNEFGQELWMMDVPPGEDESPTVQEPAVAPSQPEPFQLRAGIFRVSGTDSADTIIVRRRASNSKMIEVVLNGAPRSYRFADVAQMIIDAGAGNDTITFDVELGNPGFKTVLRGGAGDDVIHGSNGADNISGGDGNDWINAGAGNDTLYGDAGDDRLFGDAGRDYLNGGAGVDLLRGGDGQDRIIATVAIDDYKGNKGDIFSLLNI